MSKTGLDAKPNLSLVQPLRAWDRQPKEGPEAFEAWNVYIAVREENAGGIREVARRVGKSATQIGKWSTRWQWVERYRTWENNQLLLQEREQNQAIRKQAQVWAERRLDIRETGFETGELLIKRAKSLLSLPVFEKKVEKTITLPDGSEIETVTHLHFQQNPRDARLFLETGLKLMRLSADMSTENVGIPADVDLDSMTDAETEAYVEKLLELRKSALGGGPE